MLQVNFAGPPQPVNPTRIALLCATRRGYLVLQKLLELAPEAELLVFSFREEQVNRRFSTISARSPKRTAIAFARRGRSTANAGAICGRRLRWI